MKRPLEQDYTSLAAYTRALEEYCDGLAQRTWVGLIYGVREEGDTVIIEVKNGSNAARELCYALIGEMEKNT